MTDVQRARTDNASWHTTQAWNRLHYLPEQWPEEDWEATAICGLTTTFALPGVLSRLGMSRCAKCCRKLGVPRGHGTLPNDLERKKVG